ncbi:MAG: hypothetical protein ACLU30_01230 [Odoribacter splanchnicus]
MNVTKPERSIKGREICRGDDILEKQLGELLRNKKVTMATAESCQEVTSPI